LKAQDCVREGLCRTVVYLASEPGPLGLLTQGNLRPHDLIAGVGLPIALGAVIVAFALGTRRSEHPLACPLDLVD
jgi:hypothetical protein